MPGLSVVGSSAARILPLLILAACSTGPNRTDGDIATGAFTAGTTATPDIPAYDDAAGQSLRGTYGGKMRASFGGGAFEEAEASTAVDSWHEDLSGRFDVQSFLPAGTVNIGFGRPGDDTVVPGTYRCADHDMSMFFAKAGGNELRFAKTCMLAIDKVAPVVDYSLPDDYVRVWARFTADASPPNGLPVSIRGAFVADIPRPVRPYPRDAGPG